MADEKKGTIDPKYLKGLTYAEVKHEKVKDKKTGKEKNVHTPAPRPLTAKDVASFAEYDDKVVICSKDGKKHTVAK